MEITWKAKMGATKFDVDCYSHEISNWYHVDENKEGSGKTVTVFPLMYCATIRIHMKGYLGNHVRKVDSEYKH
jgi:hypothetical protein